MTITKRLEKILATESAVLDRVGRELSMNFNVPARDIIWSACSELGITRKQWDQLQSMRIYRDERFAPGF